MTDTNEAQAIIETARLSTTPHKVDPGRLYVVQNPHGHTVVDLTGDQYREFPRRKAGHVVVRDVASFAHYYERHHDGDSETFADLDAATITAVLDAHRATEEGDADEFRARWQAHRLTLALCKTPEWQAWTGSDRQPLSQQAFAEFIEDHAADVSADSPASAAELLEMAQKFQAHTKVQFSSAKRLASGETQLTYAETIEAKAGDRGTIEIPESFQLAIAPFEDCSLYRVRARFRYRLNGGELRMFYHLENPDRIFRDAVLQVVEKAADACGVTVMRGKPA